MKNYELTCLISSELKSEEAEKIAGEISDFVQKEGGIIIKPATADYKALGYTIKKQSACFLMTLDFSLEPEKVNALNVLEDKIKKDQKILRHMITIKKPLTEKYKSRRSDKVFSDKKVFLEEGVPRSPFGDRDPGAERLGAEKKSEKKVELKDIDEKLEEILRE